MSTLATRYEIGTRWAPLVQAAGMYSEVLLPENIYALASAILADAVVHARVTEAANKYVRETGNCMLPDDFTMQVLAQLTPLEKRELKERVAARHGKVAK